MNNTHSARRDNIIRQESTKKKTWYHPDTRCSLTTVKLPDSFPVSADVDWYIWTDLVIIENCVGYRYMISRRRRQTTNYIDITPRQLPLVIYEITTGAAGYAHSSGGLDVPPSLLGVCDVCPSTWYCIIWFLFSKINLKCVGRYNHVNMHVNIVCP